MSENLRVSKYNDGSPIPQVTDQNEWANSTTPAWCWYDNDSAIYNAYGKYYNYYSVADSNSKNICPVGWHVPSNEEWTVLTEYLASNGYEGTEGTSLKASEGWGDVYEDPFGFNALPAGFRNHGGVYGYNDSYTYYWTTNDYIVEHFAYVRELDISHDAFDTHAYQSQHGFSVRCIKGIECDTTYSLSIDTSSCNIYISEGGKQLTESGVLIDSFVTENGCDSIVNINVIINSSKTSNDTTVFIVSSINYEGHALVVDSIGIDTLVDVTTGCDSFVLRYEKYKYNPSYCSDTTYVSVDDTLVITMSSDTSTGIDFLTTEVNVYPNPASTQLNVVIDRSGDYTVSLTNINGQMVFTQANVMSNIQIDISEFTKGLYFITITDNDGVLKAEERKIVIE
jgi:uncharacterized protein (TIGR02145 family)